MNYTRENNITRDFIDDNLTRLLATKRMNKTKSERIVKILIDRIDGKKLREIGYELGISKDRVSQLEALGVCILKFSTPS